MRVTATIIAALVLAAPAAAQSRFNAMWGISANDVWAVGDQGVAAHLTGQGWLNTPTGTTNELRDVWASGPRDVWAVGDDATILRMTGTAWTWVRPPVRRHFISVRGCGANDVWVLGQSADNNQPSVLLHFDGNSWTVEQTPFPLRPAGLSLTCAGVAGAGPAGLTVAGTAFFDPSPQQRRVAGTILKRSGGSWTSQGYDGRAVTDTLLAGASWTSVATVGTVTLLAGQDPNGGLRLLLSRGNAWNNLAPPTVPNVEPADFRFTLAGDGTPIAVFESGLARYSGGRWVVTSAGEVSLGMSAAEQAEYLQLAQNMGQGRQLTQQQMQRFQELAMKMQSAGMNMAAAATRAGSLTFGRDPAAWSASAATVLVASQNQSIVRVTGDSAEIVWSTVCTMAQMAQLEPCSNHAARGTPPAPASGPQPEPPPEAAPAAAPPPAPAAAPRVPSVPRPRIPRP